VSGSFELLARVAQPHKKPRAWSNGAKEASV